MTALPLIHDNQHEMLDIVDENDVILFQTNKQDAYDRNLRKRIAHVIVIDPKTQKIGIQNRGATVSWQPGYYCTTACGHVGAGETWVQGALRELQEEMGVTAPLKLVSKFPYDCDFGKSFYMGVFTAQIPAEKLKPDLREVSALDFYTTDETREIIAKNDRLHNLFKAAMERYLQMLA